jgi:hypothetical protein
MIVFQNEGLMPLEAATTFGINVKLGENPIGFFGTGLKYAIAVTLRLGGKFRLFLGETEYEFYTKDSDFRGKEFGFIRMKKRKSLLGKWSYEKLAYTTELGKHWEPWMAVREIESNTRDESGISYEYSSPYSVAKQMFPRTNRTVIMIECPEMEEAYEDLETIFRPEQKLLAEIGPLKIYKGNSNYIFFRGLRVTDLHKPSIFTYDFDLGVTLTEDRTSRFPHSDSLRIMEAFMSTNNPDLLDAIMDADEDNWFEGSLQWDQPYISSGPSYYAALGSRLAEGKKLPKRMKAYYKSLQVEEDPNETFSLRLTKAQMEEIVSLNPSDDIIKEIRETFEDNRLEVDF